MLQVLIGLAIGAAAGFVANKIMKDNANNIALDCLIGMIGGALGIGLFSLLGFKVTNLIAEFVSAVVGSIIIFYIKQLVVKKIKK